MGKDRGKRGGGAKGQALFASSLAKEGMCHLQVTGNLPDTEFHGITKWSLSLK